MGGHDFEMLQHGELLGAGIPRVEAFGLGQPAAIRPGRIGSVMVTFFARCASSTVFPGNLELSFM
jgi:hypothetical protein